MGLNNPSIVKAATVGADQANALRTIFFGLCFFSIGMITDVRKLLAAGMGRIVAVYVVCLFGFIIWVGLLVSWVFYHGIEEVSDVVSIETSSMHVGRDMEFQNQELSSLIKYKFTLISKAGTTEANTLEEPGAVISHAGICAGCALQGSRSTNDL